MNTKVIACDLKEEDVYMKCKGLIALIYDYSVNYDYYVTTRDKYNEIRCARAIDVLTFFLNDRLLRIEKSHKLSILGEIQAYCLQVMQQAKSEKVKQTARDIYELYGKIIAEDTK